MKFKTTISELKKAMQILNSIINHNHTQLIYRYLLIRLKRNQIELKAFDNYTIGSVFINYYDMKDEDKENRYILGKYLFGLINGFNNGEVVISFEDNKCFFIHGNSKYTLPLLDEEYASENGELLDIDYYQVYTPDYQISVKEFTDKYNSISHCLSKDLSQYDLQNIYITDGRMIACDGIRGATIDFDKSVNDLSLHKKACDCLMNVGQVGEIHISVSNGKIIGNTENFIFTTTIETKYPYEEIKEIIDNYDKLDDAYYIKIDPDTVLDALNRILIFSDTETNSVGIKCSKDTLTLFVENRTHAYETIKLFESSGDLDLSLFVDGKNLKEALYKSVSDTKWVTKDSNQIQYLYDGKVLQFFIGLEK